VGGLHPTLLLTFVQDGYNQNSFRFKFDIFNHTRTLEEQTAIIESFSYMKFAGPIRLRNADQTFVVHELWSYERPRKLLKIYLGRFVRHPSYVMC